MADIIKFEGKKFDDDEEALLSSLLEPEDSLDIDAGDTSGETIEAGKDNVVPLPVIQWPPVVWDEVEAIRKTEYPRIPQKALAIMRDMFQNPGDESHFEFNDFGDEVYPPDPIPLRPVQGDAIWMLDMLDRYGGEVRCGKHRCIIKRTKKKAALFLIQQISRVTRDALIDQVGLGSLFEHFLQSKSWTIWGKELTDKLMMLIVNNRQDEDLIFVGFFDRRTAWVLFRRMNDISIERVLGL